MDTWIQFVIAACCVLTLLGGIVGGLVGLGIKLGRLGKQITPNGGNTDTIGDRVVRLEWSNAHQVQALKRIERRLGIEHDWLDAGDESRT